MATDYEIKTMQAQAASANDFSTQVSAHLNLGDLRTTRNETELAHQEYTTALAAAQRERKEMREDAQAAEYAIATIFAGIAEAKLGHQERAFELLEEAIRYNAEDPHLWNDYSSGMGAMHLARRAASAARNAVALESSPLELALDQYSLAISLDEAGDNAEAMKLLESVIASLKSSKFNLLRRDVARHESFETYSTVRTDVAAYLTVLLRSQIQLANMYEQRGDIAQARKAFEDALKTRTDDPTALGALARLSNSTEAYAQAFDANPFSSDLIDDYKTYVRTANVHTERTSTGAQMRRAIEQITRGEDVAAKRTLEGLNQKFPNNDAIRSLASDIASHGASAAEFLKDLRATLTLLAQEKVTPEQRAQLDRTTLTGTAIFDAMPFESGTIDGVPFRFSEAMVFKGTFAAKTPLRLTYRILGATEWNGASALLLEPIRVEAAR